MSDEGQRAIDRAWNAYEARLELQRATPELKRRAMQGALAAYLDALSPEWRLVPLYPTDNMWAQMGEPDRVGQVFWVGDFGNFAALVADLANAAPPPPGLEPDSHE